MTNIGIDTVSLLLKDWHVEPGSKMTVVNNTDLETGEPINEHELIPGVFGSKIHLNDQNNLGIGFEIKPFFALGGLPIATMHFSVGRVANGSNYEPPKFDETIYGFEIVQTWLADHGIVSDFGSADITRLDTVRNILTDEQDLKPYFSVLQLCDMPRTTSKDFGGEGLQIGNKQQQYCCYDKLQAMKFNKQDTTGFPVTLRIEHRPLHSAKVRSIFGIRTVNDLLKTGNQNLIQEKYIYHIGKNLFKVKPNDMRFHNHKTLAEMLFEFMQSHGRNFRQSFRSEYGDRCILEQFGLDTWLDVNQSIDAGFNRAREKSRLHKVWLKIQNERSDFFHVKTNADLYEEIKMKALQRVA